MDASLPLISSLSMNEDGWWTAIAEIEKMEREHATVKRKACQQTDHEPATPHHSPEKKKKRQRTLTMHNGTTVVRLQRRGDKVLQGCDVYIGRRWTMGGWDLPQSKWANPYTVKSAGSAEKAVKLYENHLMRSPELLASLGELNGKVLGCWCKKKPTDPCHGDVLVRLANEARQ